MWILKKENYSNNEEIVNLKIEFLKLTLNLK